MINNNLTQTKQYFFLRLIYDTAFFILDLYYMVLIYKETQDLRWIIANVLLMYICVLPAFYFSLTLIRKTSLNITVKISFILFVVMGLFGAYGISNIPYFFLLFAIVRGIAEGIYWGSTNLIELNGLKSEPRSQYYSFSSGFNQIIYILLPVLLGTFLFSTDQYQIIFLLFSGVSLLGIFFPWNFDKMQVSRIKFSNLVLIMKRKTFPKFALLKFGSSVWWMTLWFVSSIIPYVILGNELNMGIYLSIASIFSAIIAFISTKMKLKNKKLIGYFGLILQLFSNLLLALNLTQFYLYINSLITSLTDTSITPSETELIIKTTEIAQEGREQGAEIQIIQETIFTIARLVFGGIYILLLSNNFNLQYVLAIFLAIVGITRLVLYYMNDRFIQKQL